MRKKVGLLLVIVLLLVGSVIGFGWYRFRTPLAHHMDLAPTISVSDFPLPLTKHSLTTTDQVKLVGYSATQEHAKGWIILVHGFTPNGWKSMLGVGTFLYTQGYNIFLPSLRSFGESEGDFIYLGTREWQDLWAAHRLVEDELNPQQLPIGWYGVSMGAATTLTAAAKGNGLADFLIIQVPFASVQHLLLRQIQDEGVLREAFKPLTYVIPQLELGWDYRENEPLFSPELITVPTLIMGAERDNQVLFEDSRLLFDSIGTPAEQKVYKSFNTGHDIYAEQPDLVQKTLLDFLTSIHPN